MQFIHNAPDPALSTIDVYVDGVLALQNFRFRTATASLPALAGNHRIGVAKKNSNSEADTFYSTTVSIASGSRNAFIASGYVTPGFYKYPGVDDKFKVVSLLNLPGALSAPANRVTLSYVSSVADLGRHVLYGRGSYDQIVNFDTIKYNEVHGTINPLAVNDYKFEDRNASNFAEREIEFDFFARRGQNGILILSGVTDSVSIAHNAMPFQMYVIWADGSMQRGRILPRAIVKFINVVPDTAFHDINVYFNKYQRVYELPYQNATQNTWLPAGPTKITVSEGYRSVGDSVYTTIFTLDSNKRYYGIIHGVVPPDSFKANPAGTNISTRITFIEEPRKASVSGDKVTAKLFHAVTDGSRITLYERKKGPLTNDIAYGELSNEFSVTPGPIKLDITKSSSIDDEISSWEWNLKGTDSIPGVLIYTGFMDSSRANRYGNGERLVWFADKDSEKGMVLSRIATRTGIESQNARNAGLFIYPNPAHNVVNVQLPTLKSATSLRMLDANGRAISTMSNVNTHSGSNVTLPLDGMKPGVYFIQVRGDINITEKVIVY